MKPLPIPNGGKSEQRRRLSDGEARMETCPCGSDCHVNWPHLASGSDPRPDQVGVQEDFHSMPCRDANAIWNSVKDLPTAPGGASKPALSAISRKFVGVAAGLALALYLMILAAIYILDRPKPLLGPGYFNDELRLKQRELQHGVG